MTKYFVSIWIRYDRVCQFFNRDQALSPDYKSVLKNEGVDIVNWGDLKNDAKDRFTVIDHKNKICYTGKELYEYALQNGYSLDGKGTKLEKGVLSGLMDINGKPAKVRLHEHGTSIIYRKEALTGSHLRKEIIEATEARST